MGHTGSGPQVSRGPSCVLGALRLLPGFPSPSSAGLSAPAVLPGTLCDASAEDCLAAPDLTHLPVTVSQLGHYVVHASTKTEAVQFSLPAGASPLPGPLTKQCGE